MGLYNFEKGFGCAYKRRGLYPGGGGQYGVTAFHFTGDFRVVKLCTARESVKFGLN